MVMKIGNECYDDTGYKNEYFVSDIFLNFILSIFFIILLLLNILLGYKNKIILGLFVLFILYIIYRNTLGPYLEKRSFVKKQGKKVQCT